MSFNFVKYAVLPSLFLCNNVFSSETFPYLIVLKLSHAKNPIEYTYLKDITEIQEFTNYLTLTKYEDICEDIKVFQIDEKGKKTEIEITKMPGFLPIEEDDKARRTGISEMQKLAIIHCIIFNIVYSQYKEFKGDFSKLPYRIKCYLSPFILLLAQIFNSCCFEASDYLGDRFETAKLLLLSQCNYLNSPNSEETPDLSKAENFIPKKNANWFVIDHAIEYIYCFKCNEYNKEAEDLLKILDTVPGKPYEKLLTKE